MSDTFDPMKYYLCSGTVQAYVYRMGDSRISGFMCFFGCPKYDSRKPVISESLREQAQPIVDKLNRGEMTEEQARKELDKIRY